MATGSLRARQTLAFLREKIVSGEWPINAKIPTESELVELLGVGKTTVREAVRSLSSLGMLEPMPGIGTFVRSTTPVSSALADQIADYSATEVLIYRRALEVEAARQASINRTEEALAALKQAHILETTPGTDYSLLPERGRTPGQFHSLIFKASASEILQNQYAGLLVALRRALENGEITMVKAAEQRQANHGQLLDAITRKDAGAAAEIMAEHTLHDLVLKQPTIEN